MAFHEETTWKLLVIAAVATVIVVLGLFWLDFWFGEDRWVPAFGLIAAGIVAADLVLRVKPSTGTAGTPDRS